MHRAAVSATAMPTTAYEGLRQDARPGMLYTAMMVCAPLARLSALGSETSSLKTAKRYFVLMPMAAQAAKPKNYVSLRSDQAEVKYLGITELNMITSLLKG